MKRPASGREPILITDRLTLRALNPADAPALHAMLSDPDAVRWGWRPPTTSLAETRAYLNQPNGRGWRWWIITRTGEDRALGWVSAGHQRRRGVTEIGYILAPSAQGQGLAHEAVSAVIDRLFAEGRRRIIADTDAGNAPSNRLLARLGFLHEATLHGDRTPIGVRDSLIWGLLAAEWRVSS